MSVFGNYSLYYDLLYQDKDYGAEANYILNLINKFSSRTKDILELGCGTGKHGQLLNEKGFNIHGIDISSSMLERALKFRSEKLFFEVGDVRSYRANKKFDSVLSLFHVASYQTSNEDLKKYFETASYHLNKGGVFIFDVWYGPAVLNQRPESRIKNLENDLIKVERKATPIIHYNENVVDVNYEILITNKLNKSEERISEIHKMRYLFKPELELLIENSGLKMVHSEEWLSGKEIGPNSWGACFVVIKM